jgi:hypothetical protein
LNLEEGYNYTYKVEKSGFISREEEIIIHYGGSVDTIILYTEDELKFEKEENWSEYLGVMNWNNANKICNDVEGRRLPSLRELYLAYKVGIAKSWQYELSGHLSSTQFDEKSLMWGSSNNIESYYNVSAVNGYISGQSSDHYGSVRCRR